mmetsp:Transcript_61227/g.181080  ORF Transcript_61227/g.181080 Transcript_61227/m.181080 type:complete len:559 (-) Transcript_61227:532-2208(-)
MVRLRGLFVYPFVGAASPSLQRRTRNRAVMASIKRKECGGGEEDSDIEILLESGRRKMSHHNRNESEREHDIVEICSSDEDDDGECVISDYRREKPSLGVLLSDGNDLPDVEMEEVLDKENAAGGEDSNQKNTLVRKKSCDGRRGEIEKFSESAHRMTLDDFNTSDAEESDEESYFSYYSSEQSTSMEDILATAVDFPAHIKKNDEKEAVSATSSIKNPAAPNEFSWIIPGKTLTALGNHHSASVLSSPEKREDQWVVRIETYVRCIDCKQVPLKSSGLSSKSGEKRTSQRKEILRCDDAVNEHFSDRRMIRGNDKNEHEASNFEFQETSSQVPLAQSNMTQGVTSECSASNGQDNKDNWNVTCNSRARKDGDKSKSSNCRQGKAQKQTLRRTKHAGSSKPRRKSTRCLKSRLDLRRELMTSIAIAKDKRQSDNVGAGIIAQRRIRKGEVLFDFAAMFCHGDPPANLDWQRADFIMYGEGYFLLIATPTEWMNEALDGQEPNITWRKKYYDRGNFRNSDVDIGHHVLLWKALRDIEVGEELLAAYRSKQTIPQANRSR